MSAYFFVNVVEITDFPKMERYRSGVLATVKQFGGQYRCVGGKAVWTGSMNFTAGWSRAIQSATPSPGELFTTQTSTGRPSNVAGSEPRHAGSSSRDL